jgi:hypothetical protein
MLQESAFWRPYGLFGMTAGGALTVLDGGFRSPLLEQAIQVEARGQTGELSHPL